MGKDVRTIGIVGTGMIATSMAVLGTGHGFRTYVLVRSDASRLRCEKNYDEAFAAMAEKGLITADQIAVCKSYLHFTMEYADMAEAEAIFECVVEDLDTKHEVYRKIEENCPKVKGIGSVSSSIVPELLAEGIEKYGDRIIVTHPFNPAHMVPYFELCAGEKTNPDVLPYLKSVLEDMDRKPVILKKSTPGFIGNRLQFALWRECLTLLEEGICEARDIDTCLEYSFCPRYTSIGIFEHFDNGGLPLNQAVCKNLFPIIGDTKEVPEVINRLIDEGKLGLKAGEGFYDWRNVDLDEFKERVNKPYWNFCNWDFPAEKE